MTRRGLASAALLMGAFTAGAPALASSLRVQLNADIRSTSPGVNRDDNTDAVVLHVVEGLVAYGDNAEVKPLLAESVAVSDDGRTYTFKLRKGVKFHNGAELGSADVLWSWQHYMNPKTEWRCLAEHDGRGRAKVEAVDAPDADTVVFRLDRPSALFLANLARTDCGMTGILHQDSVKPDGSWDKPVGTGPFRFTEWKRGEYIRLSRHEAYASRDGGPDGYAGSKRPLVDELRFIVVPDSSAAKAGLLRGDLDVVPNIPNADVRELEKEPKVQLSISTNMGTVGVLLQTRDPLLANVKLRQAIAAAIDTEQLVAAVTEGLGKRNNSIVPLTSRYYGAVEAQGYEHDPATARRLLAEVGYKGEPLVLFTNKRYPASFEAAVIVQAMLAAAGINVRLEVLEWATQLDRYNAGNYQMMAFLYSPRLDPALSFDAIMGPKDKQPRKVWDDPEAQALLDRAMVVSDPAERQRLFDELHRRFIAAVPMLMFYNGIDPGAVSRRVKGYRSSIFSKPLLWEVGLAD